MKKKTKRRILDIIFLVLIAAIYLYLYRNDYFNFSNNNETVMNDGKEGNLEIHYIDVGQGDAALVRFNNKNMLIDSGPRESQDKILKYLDSLNIKTINIIIGSHPHEDHMGNMASIVKKYSIGSFYAPKAIATQYFFENLVKELNNKNLKITPVHSDMVISFDPKIEINVYWPEENEEYDNLNNYSIVMSLKYQNNSFLFTGDVESNCEKKIVENGSDISCDVLKVAHHGSKTSSSKKFLDACNGKYAIIECGVDNQYSHPDKSIVNELTKRNYEIYRTDLDGNIFVKSDGNKITIETNK